MRDGQLGVEDWGFRLEDIEVEAGKGMRFYYGDEDRNTPVEMGRRMAEKVKGAVMREYRGETHITLFERRGEEILRDFIGGEGEL